MKVRITFFLPMIALLMHCATSDPAPQLTEEEKQMLKLTKTWTLGKVEYGDNDVSHRFDGFSLTLTEAKAYNTGGELGDYDFEPFKVTGTWDFKDGNLSILRRDDGVDMVAQVTDKTLTLAFTMTEANGRVRGLGAYRFDLVTNE